MHPGIHYHRESGKVKTMESSTRRYLIMALVLGGIGAVVTTAVEPGLVFYVNESSELYCFVNGTTVQYCQNGSTLYWNESAGNLSDFVLKTGDTMTGDLIMNSSPSIYFGDPTQTDYTFGGSPFGGILKDSSGGINIVGASVYNKNPNSLYSTTSLYGHFWNMMYPSPNTASDNGTTQRMSITPTDYYPLPLTDYGYPLGMSPLSRLELTDTVLSFQGGMSFPPPLGQDYYELNSIQSRGNGIQIVANGNIYDFGPNTLNLTGKTLSGVSDVSSSSPIIFNVNQSATGDYSKMLVLNDTSGDVESYHDLVYNGSKVCTAANGKCTAINGTAFTIARFDGSNGLNDSALTDDGVSVSSSLKIRGTVGGSDFNPTLAGTTATSTGLNIVSATDMRLVLGGSSYLGFNTGAITANQNFRIIDGINSIPGLNFRDDSNTGFYRVSSDTIGGSLGGKRSLTMNKTTLNYTGEIKTDQFVGYRKSLTTQPVYSFDGDLDTGIGLTKTTGNSMNLIAGGVRAFNVLSNSVNAFLPLNMNSNKITSLATPTTGTDAATKAYVDSVSGGENYDQNLNTTDNVTFSNLNIGDVMIAENDTIFPGSIIQTVDTGDNLTLWAGSTNHFAGGNLGAGINLLPDTLGTNPAINFYAGNRKMRFSNANGMQSVQSDMVFSSASGYNIKFASAETSGLPIAFDCSISATSVCYALSQYPGYTGIFAWGVTEAGTMYIGDSGNNFFALDYPTATISASGWQVAKSGYSNWKGQDLIISSGSGTGANTSNMDISFRTPTTTTSGSVQTSKLERWNISQSGTLHPNEANGGQFDPGDCNLINNPEVGIVCLNHSNFKLQGYNTTGWRVNALVDTNQHYGELYIHTDTGETQEIVLGVPMNISDLSAGIVKGINLLDNLTGTEYRGFNITTGGVYSAKWALSFTGGVTDEYQATILKNDAEEIQCEAHRKIGSGGDVGSFSNSCYINASVGDTLTIGLQDEDNPVSDATIYAMNFNIMRIDKQ